MMRLFVSIIFELIANAIGLLIAAWLLPDFRITPLGFLMVVAIYTIVKFVLGPLILQLSIQYVRAFAGGVSLVTTFVGLWITAFLTSELVVTGFTTWILATLIVWLCGVVASIVLPMFLFKEILQDVRDRRTP